MRQSVEQLCAAHKRRVAMRQQETYRPIAAPGQRNDALAAASDPGAMALGIGAQAHGQPRGGIGEPLAPACAADVLRAVRALRQAGNQLAATSDPCAQQVGSEPPRNARELGVMNLRIGDQRARKPCACMIETLARQCQLFLPARQSANRRTQLGASRVLAALPAGERPVRQALGAQ